MLDIKELVIYLTSKCNLDCRHCYIKKEDRRLGLFKLSKEQLNWIANNINPKKVVFLGGEPTLYNYFDYAIDLFQSSKITISTNAQTNSTLEKIIDNKDKIEAIQISIEGGKEETDYLRGNGYWDRVVKAIKILRKNKVDIYLRSSFWMGDYNNLDEVIKLGSNFNIPIAFFPRVDKPIIPTMMMKDLFDECLKHNNCIVAIPNFFQYIGKKGRCSAGSERLSVFYDGRITPCNMDLSYTIAKIGDNIHTIKSNIDFYLNEIKTTPIDCLSCPHSSVCKGSCYVAKAWLSCPLRHNIDMEYSIQHNLIDGEKVYERAEMATNFMRNVIVC